MNYLKIIKEMIMNSMILKWFLKEIIRYCSHIEIFILLF